VDFLPEVAKQLHISDVPVTFVYKEGKLSSGFMGVKDKEAIESEHLYTRVGK
jgi:thioredoxin-like negative regulator of GroEL